tara:strand:+ start:262 stop:2148 length:1887 start_codon:yes stop_codon:yes gene_type:complete
MAIPFLNHLDLRSVSELQNAILHKTTESSASNVEGKIIYDTGTDTIKYYNGSGWISLTGQDANTFRTVKVDTTNNGAANVTLDPSEDLQLIGGTNITLAESSGVVTISAGAATTVGKTSGTQRSGEIELIAGTNVTITEDGTTGHFTFAATDTNTNQLTRWRVRDDDNDDKIVAHNSYLKFTAATGAAGTNVTGTGTTSDPFVMAITLPNDNDNTQNTTTLSFVDSSDDIILRNTTGGAGSGTQDIKFVAGSNITLTHTDANNIIIASSDNNTNTGADMTQATLKTKLGTGFPSNAVTIGDSNDTVTIGNDLVITGDLTVNGDTVSANVSTLDVEDKNITINKGSGDTSSTANGAGITIQDAVNSSTDATLLWDATDDEFDFSHGITVPSIKIGGTDSDSLYQAASSKLTELATMHTSVAEALADLLSTEVQLIDGATLTTTELNLLDGDTAVGTTSVANGDGFIHNDNGTMRVTSLDKLAERFAGTNIQRSGTVLSVSGANTTTKGVVEIATTTEASAGTSSATVVTPAGVKQFDDDRKHVSNITAAISAGATHTITHNLGTKDLIVQIIAQVPDLTTSGTNIVDQYAEVKLDVIRATDNTITIQPNIAIRAISNTGSLRVLIKALD